MTLAVNLKKMTIACLLLAVILNTVAWGQVASRTLPAFCGPRLGAAVTVQVNPPAPTTVWAVEETPPAGWTVDNISHGGSWDSVKKKVKWGIYFDATSRTLTYRATPPAGATGTKSFSGTLNLDGRTTAVLGTNTTVVDSAAPTGTLKINGGASWTSASSVMLALTASDGAGCGISKMRLSADTVTWSHWEDFRAGRSWQLGGIGGPKTVYVQLKDRVDNVSANLKATISLIFAPGFLTQPSALTLNPGVTATFSVTTTGTAPLACQWKKDGVNLANGGGISGATTTRLTISGVQWGYGGLYTCQVANTAGSAISGSARLTVNPTLIIRSTTGSPSPAVGSTVYPIGSKITASVPGSTVTDSKGTTRWVCTGWLAQGAAPAGGAKAIVTFNIDRPTTLTWLWQKQYKLTATGYPWAWGRVTMPDGVTNVAGTWHADGTVLTLRGVANPGYRFAYWWNDLRGHSSPAMLLMNQPRSIMARFQSASNGVDGWRLYRE